MIKFEGEEFGPGRVARMDQSLAATDDDIRKLKDRFRVSLDKAEGDEYLALSMQVTACYQAMVEHGLTHEQIGNIPLVLARMVMLLARQGDDA